MGIMCLDVDRVWAETKGGCAQAESVWSSVCLRVCACGIVWCGVE
jgi:hypothetical protein